MKEKIISGVILVAVLIGVLLVGLLHSEQALQAKDNYKYRVTIVYTDRSERNRTYEQWYTNKQPKEMCWTRVSRNEVIKLLPYITFTDAKTGHEIKLYPGEDPVIVEKLN